MHYSDEAESEAQNGELKHISVYVPNVLAMGALANQLASNCESEIEIDLGVRIPVRVKKTRQNNK